MSRVQSDEFEKARLRMEQLKEKVRGYKANPPRILTIEEMTARVNSPEHQAQVDKREKEFEELCAKSYDERFDRLIAAIDHMASILISFENNGPDDCEVMLDELSHRGDDTYPYLQTIKEALIDPFFADESDEEAED